MNPELEECIAYLLRRVGYRTNSIASADRFNQKHARLLQIVNGLPEEAQTKFSTLAIQLQTNIQHFDKEIKPNLTSEEVSKHKQQFIEKIRTLFSRSILEGGLGQQLRVIRKTPTVKKPKIKYRYNQYTPKQLMELLTNTRDVGTLITTIDWLNETL